MPYLTLTTTLFSAEISLRMYLSNQLKGIKHSEQVLGRVGPKDRYRHNGRCCSLDSRIQRSIASRKRKIAMAEMRLNALLA
jgi:hypothetical protein